MTLPPVEKHMAKRRKPHRNPQHGKGLLLRSKTTAPRAKVSDKAPVELHLMNFEITWDLIPDPEVEALPQATRDRMQQLFDLVHQQPKSVITELRKLAVHHPRVLCLRNWLISALRGGSASDHAEALIICEQLFHETPDYFFARTTLADLWLDAGEVEKAAALIFGPELVLTRLYPGREVFHISEIRHWAYLCGRIKILQGEPEIAEGYRDMLAELEPDSGPVRHLNEMLEGEMGMLARLISEFKKLSEKTKVSHARRQRQKAALQQPVAKKSAPKSRKPTSSPDQIELFGDA